MSPLGFWQSFQWSDIFANGKSKPASMNNVLNRQILPALREAGLKDRTGNELWHGWHSFRRGLATTLYGLGVDDLMIQQILRHTDVTVRHEHYTKTHFEQSVAVMSKLESALTALCSDCAQPGVPAKSRIAELALSFLFVMSAMGA